MPMRFPPISAMRAIESAARHLSYTRAAEELFVTQSAISHQIKHAESLWEIKLFERNGRNIQLTDNGKAIVPIIRDFLERIQNTLTEISEKEIEKVDALNMTLLQSFALRWLIPRLGHFKEQHAEMEIWINTSEALVDFAEQQIDVGIRLGHGEWKGMFAEKLLDEYFIPVCSPDYLKQHGKPQVPSDLLKMTLLRRGAIDILPRWRDWFKVAGVKIGSMPRGAQFPELGMAVQAALDGQGIVFTRISFVIDDLKAGRLVQLFPQYAVHNGVSYYFVCELGREQEARILTFRDWLNQQAQLSQQELEAHLEHNGVNQA